MTCMQSNAMPIYRLQPAVQPAWQHLSSIGTKAVLLLQWHFAILIVLNLHFNTAYSLNASLQCRFSTAEIAKRHC